MSFARTAGDGFAVGRSGAGRSNTITIERARGERDLGKKHMQGPPTRTRPRTRLSFPRPVAYIGCACPLRPREARPPSTWFPAPAPADASAIGFPSLWPPPHSTALLRAAPRMIRSSLWETADPHPPRVAAAIPCLRSILAGCLRRRTSSSANGPDFLPQVSNTERPSSRSPSRRAVGSCSRPQPLNALGLAVSPGRGPQEDRLSSPGRAVHRFRLEGRYLRRAQSSKGPNNHHRPWRSFPVSPRPFPGPSSPGVAWLLVAAVCGRSGVHPRGWSGPTGLCPTRARFSPPPPAPTRPIS